MFRASMKPCQGSMETNKEEAAKDQELNRKIGGILSLMKDMVGKSNLC